jgi:hypothetical protein
MACAYCVDPGDELVLFRPTGRFTETNFIALCRAAYDDSRRRSHFAHVWDTRAIDELIMDATVISMYRELLVEKADRVTEGKVAVIATRALTRTFASMLIQVSKDHPATFRLFGQVEAAAEWVGVSTSALIGMSERDWTKI